MGLGLNLYIHSSAFTKNRWGVQGLGFLHFVCSQLRKATAVHFMLPAPFVDPISIYAVAETVEKLAALLLQV